MATYHVKRPVVILEQFYVDIDDAGLSKKKAVQKAIAEAKRLHPLSDRPELEPFLRNGFVLPRTIYEVEPVDPPGSPPGPGPECPEHCPHCKTGLAREGSLELSVRRPSEKGTSTDGFSYNYLLTERNAHGRVADVDGVIADGCLYEVRCATCNNTIVRPPEGSSEPSVEGDPHP
jgi:hypothetical protein